MYVERQKCLPRLPIPAVDGKPHSLVVPCTLVSQFIQHFRFLYNVLPISASMPPETTGTSSTNSAISTSPPSSPSPTSTVARAADVVACGNSNSISSPSACPGIVSAGGTGGNADWTMRDEVRGSGAGAGTGECTIAGAGMEMGMGPAAGRDSAGMDEAMSGVGAGTGLEGGRMGMVIPAAVDVDALGSR